MGRWDGQGWRNREYAKKVWCSPSVEKSAEGFFICQKVVESRMMLWYYKCAAVPPAEGRWFYMNDNISAFIISVAASVVGYYICKWLDRWWTGGNSLNGLARRKEQEKPQSCNSGVFVLFYMNSFSIYLAKIIICHFRGKVNRFFLSEENPRKIHGKSTGRSLGKSGVTSTSTITSTITIIIKRIYAKPPSAVLLLCTHLKCTNCTKNESAFWRIKSQSIP